VKDGVLYVGSQPTYVQGAFLGQGVAGRVYEATRVDSHEVRGGGVRGGRAGGRRGGDCSAAARCAEVCDQNREPGAVQAAPAVCAARVSDPVGGAWGGGRGAARKRPGTDGRVVSRAQGSDTVKSTPQHAPKLTKE
jgi:hypothetical protein